MMENKLQKRLNVRPKHLSNLPKDHVICAGGLLTEDGKMKGAAIIMEFLDRAALDLYLSTEPYVTEEVWKKIIIETINAFLSVNRASNNA